MYYEYPPTDSNIEPLRIRAKDHTMGSSLFKYLELKIHPLLLQEDISRVEIVGVFDRTQGVSSREKAGKLFNYMRPTAAFQEETLQIRCFPGWDYVFHFANTIASFFNNNERNILINCTLPLETDCWTPLLSSSIQQIPVVSGGFRGDANL